jgi:SNF family Na+-dependent transporter
MRRLRRLDVMASTLEVVGKVVCILFILVLSVLIWKTAEYFNGLQKTDKHTPLLAWDVLVLFITLCYFAVRLVIA